MTPHTFAPCPNCHAWTEAPGTCPECGALVPLPILYVKAREMGEYYQVLDHLSEESVTWLEVHHPPVIRED